MYLLSTAFEAGVLQHVEALLVLGLQVDVLHPQQHVHGLLVVLVDGVVQGGVAVLVLVATKGEGRGCGGEGGNEYDATCLPE